MRSAPGLTLGTGFVSSRRARTDLSLSKEDAMTGVPDPITPAALDAWVSEATLERLRLYTQATASNRDEREVALRGMGEALARAIEVVRAAASAMWEAKRKSSEQPPPSE
jgi:hypothetical protein